MKVLRDASKVGSTIFVFCGNNISRRITGVLYPLKGVIIFVSWTGHPFFVNYNLVSQWFTVHLQLLLQLGHTGDTGSRGVSSLSPRKVVIGPRGLPVNYNIWDKNLSNHQGYLWGSSRGNTTLVLWQLWICLKICVNQIPLGVYNSIHSIL